MRRVVAFELNCSLNRHTEYVRYRGKVLQQSLKAGRIATGRRRRAVETYAHTRWMKSLATGLCTRVTAAYIRRDTAHSDLRCGENAAHSGCTLRGAGRGRRAAAAVHDMVGSTWIND